MSEQDDINPYEAPQSKPLLARPVEECMKRPVSVKWALAMMAAAAHCLGYHYFMLFTKHGWQWMTDDLLGTTLDALRVVVFFVLWFGGRRPWVFWITSVQLGLNLTNFGKAVIKGPAIPAHDLSEQIGFYLAGILLCYHFYRFTFGQPSRVYYRIAQADAGTMKEQVRLD